MDQEHLMTGMIVLSKLQLAAGMVVKGAAAFVLAVLLDAYELILLSYLMVLLNVVSGYIVMWHSKSKWDKEKWFRTCMKLVWFPVAILSTQAIEQVYALDVPMASVVAAFITVHDLKSLFGNVTTLTGLDLWQAIASIDWKGFRKKP